MSRVVVFLAVVVLLLVPAGAALAATPVDGPAISGCARSNAGAFGCTNLKTARDQADSIDHPTGDACIDGTVTKAYQTAVLKSGSTFYKLSRCGAAPTMSSYSYYTQATANSATCPAPYVWDEVSQRCFSPQECLAKPSLSGQTYIGSTVVGALCKDGCQYEPDGDSVSVCIGDPPYGADSCMSPGKWKPSGKACAPGDPPPTEPAKPQNCIPADGMTFCVKPNGEHCASVVRTGRQICWQPRETGEKTDGESLQVRQAGETPQPPKTQPPPGESFNQGPSNKVNSNINGSPVVTNITNYVTTGGTNAGGSGNGDTGESGDGSGSNPGPGKDDGNGAGTAAGGLGTVYEGSGETLDSVWSGFKSQIENAPIVSASTSFLTFGGGGSCPTWTVPASDFWPEMTATWLCSGALADALALAGYLVLAIAAFAAFRIAVY